MIAIPNMDKPKFCDDCFVPLSKWEYFAKDGIDHCPLIDIVTCGECKHRDPEDKKCDCGMFERQGCIFPVADDYFCKCGERRSDVNNTERD